jgi:hypothetical protein
MRIIALLFSFMLTGCAGTRLDAETTPTAVAPSAPPWPQRTPLLCDGGRGDHTYGRDCRGTISQRSR